MKRISLLLLAHALLLAAAPAQDVPGGKSLAELVRERFEANPPGGSVDPQKDTGQEDDLPPAPPVETISLGPVQPPRPEPGTPEPEPPMPVETTTTEPPAPEPAPAPVETAKEPAPEEVALPDLAPAEATWTIKSGDTLTRIARSAYNSSMFAPLLEKHNGVDPRRLRIGQELETPSLSAMVREQGPLLLSAYPEATALLVRMQHDYGALEDLSRTNPPEEDLTAAMINLEQTSLHIEEILSAPRQGLSSRPGKALAQLESFRENLSAIGAGRVQILSNIGIQNRTYLATALVEAMKWAERELR